jgi:hypothetical protein
MISDEGEHEFLIALPLSKIKMIRKKDDSVEKDDLYWFTSLKIGKPKVGYETKLFYKRIWCVSIVFTLASLCS